VEAAPTGGVEPSDVGPGLPAGVGKAAPPAPLPLVSLELAAAVVEGSAEDGSGDVSGGSGASGAHHGGGGGCGSGSDGGGGGGGRGGGDASIGMRGDACEPADAAERVDEDGDDAHSARKRIKVSPDGAYAVVPSGEAIATEGAPTRGDPVTAMLITGAGEDGQAAEAAVAANPSETAALEAPVGDGDRPAGPSTIDAAGASGGGDAAPPGLASPAGAAASAGKRVRAPFVPWGPDLELAKPQMLHSNKKRRDKGAPPPAWPPGRQPTVVPPPGSTWAEGRKSGRGRKHEPFDGLPPPPRTGPPAVTVGTRFYRFFVEDESTLLGEVRRAVCAWPSGSPCESVALLGRPRATHTPLPPPSCHVRAVLAGRHPHPLLSPRHFAVRMRAVASALGLLFSRTRCGAGNEGDLNHWQR
jgi:hypothetical protein